MRSVKLIAAAGMVLAVAEAHAVGERVLFENPEYSVVVPATIRCDEPVTVSVHSADPELFEADTAAMQGLADATQAVLGFECPNVPALKFEGMLAGLGDPVYEGLAERRRNWEVATLRSIQTEQYDATAGSAGKENDYGSLDQGGAFNVANLVMGMTVDEARATVQNTFGVEPDYDIEQGILTMRSGGCPDGYDWTTLSPSPKPQWKCLQARFTDQRVARMYMVDLVQVIERDDPEAVQQYLIDRFGAPAYRAALERDRSWWQSKQYLYVMGWGEVIASQQATDGNGASDIYALQAKVLPMGDVVIVTVTLFDPRLQPAQATGSEPRITDLTL